MHDSTCPPIDGYPPRSLEVPGAHTRFRCQPVQQPVLRSCPESVLLAHSNSPSWPSRSSCRVSAKHAGTLDSTCTRVSLALAVSEWVLQQNVAHLLRVSGCCETARHLLLRVLFIKSLRCKRAAPGSCLPVQHPALAYRCSRSPASYPPEMSTVAPVTFGKRSMLAKHPASPRIGSFLELRLECVSYGLRHRRRTSVV